MNCRGVVPTAEMIGASIHCPVVMFDRYSPGILQIMFNDMSAKETTERCEGTFTSSETGEDESEDGSSSQLIDLLHRLQAESENSDDEEDSLESDD